MVRKLKISSQNKKVVAAQSSSVYNELETDLDKF